MTDQLYVYMREPEVTTLGPGKRYALWLSGCNRNCPGCIAPETREMSNGIPYPVELLATEIILSKPEGITVSGGEPFLQAEALSKFISLVKKKNKELGVIIYTGFTIAELMEKPEAVEVLKMTDLLIDGPYVKELDDGKSLRGSSNQSVIALTPRYLNDLHLYGADERETQVFNHGTFKHYVGIPTNSKYENKE